MIEKEKFLTGLALLAGAFGREVDGPVQRAYYAVLSPQLTNEEWERAVSLTLNSETFWPSPAVLLSKVKVSEEARGHLAFEHVNRVTGEHGGYRYISAETFHKEFDAPTRAAISSVGGLAAIANTSEERWASLQRKFAAAYVQSQQPRLPSVQMDSRVKELARETAALMSISGRDRAAGETAADD